MSWPQKPIGDFVLKVTKWDPRKLPDADDFLYIDLSSVDKDEKSIEHGLVERIATFDAPSRARQIVKTGDVLVATVRPNLNGVAVVSTEFDGATASTGYCVLRPAPEKLDSRYLFHWVRSSAFIKSMIKQATGANYPAVSDSIIKNDLFPAPPLPEQKRIAAILDKADQLRQKRQQAINLADEFLRCVFLEMFGDPESAGWDLVTVESLLANHKGSMRTGPFGSQLLHSEFTDSGIAVLGIDNAVKNVFKWAKPRFISEEKYQQLKKYTVYPGDVLITIMGTCGRCAVVPDDITPAINTKHLCAITLDQSKCLPRFLHSYFLMHPAAKKYLAAKAKGAIMSGLNMGVIKELPVPVAPLALQEKYHAVCQKYDHIITNLNVASQISGDNFNALSQKAFAGQL